MISVYDDIMIYPIYIPLHLVVSDDHCEASGYIEDRYDVDYCEREITNASGACWDTYDTKTEADVLLIWIHDINDLIILSHEIIHATWSIQERTGFVFSSNSQEIQTYMHDHIFREILTRTTK